MRLPCPALLAFACALFCSLHSQTIIVHDGKFGLSDEANNTVLQPEYDEVVAEELIPTLFKVRKSSKWTYFYKVDRDSTRWLNAEDRHWVLGNFEYDSLVVKYIGLDSHDSSGVRYTTLHYRQQDRWGVLLIQTHTKSGKGIFPSAEFYADGLGRLYTFNKTYDRILDLQQDGFYCTVIDQKYGLVDVLTGEEYSPDFDTVPVYTGWRSRYVKKNNKWGAMWMDEASRTIRYNAPCRCNKIAQPVSAVFACVGQGDTIIFFDSLTHSEYIPTVNGAPLKFNADSFSVIVNAYGENMQGHSVTVEVTSKYEPVGKNSFACNRVYFVDLTKKKLTAFHERGHGYAVIQSPLNGLVLKEELHPTGSRRTYSASNIRTGEAVFSFTVDTAAVLSLRNYLPRNCRKEDEQRFILFYTYGRDGEKIMGYYDFRNQKFTKKKPKYKP